MKKYVLPLVLWSGLLSAKVLEINEDHSKILFDIDYMKLTTVQGQFKKYAGSFNMNEAETEIKDISVVIKADSVDTNEPKRDFHLKGHEFF
ncbi:MAG: YceI family protein, partial [Bacteriovorax sp.]